MGKSHRLRSTGIAQRSSTFQERKAKFSMKQDNEGILGQSCFSSLLASESTKISLVNVNKSDHKSLNSKYCDSNAAEKYKCFFCSKIFSEHHLLQQHLQLHGGSKPYICSVCNKGFGTQGNLKNHFRIHTGEKPFKCHVCEHASNHLSNLKKHISTRHGIQYLNSLPH